jgi:DNA-directed RNA polymerase subunit L/DNA-directed RNA polymerase alpha subunit
MTGVESVGFRADIRDDGATTDVIVEANTTPMTNEMLAHRIGLIPIHVQSPLKWDPEKYTFVLNVVNDTDEIKDVFASDFKVFERRGEEMIPVPSSSFFIPNPVTHDTVLIATLKPLMPGGKPEEIRVQAKATVGNGRENARFIPTSQCAYGYTLDNDEARRKIFFEEWLNRSKMIKDPSILEKEPEKKEPLLREFKTLEINRCYLKNQNGEPYSFDFTIESVGVLTPEYIVLRGCELGAALCEKYTNVSFTEDVTIQQTEGKMSGFDFFFQKQDHTLGHLIQAWIDENAMKNGEVTFVGYDIPHPLRDEMVIRIGVADGKEATAREVVANAMAACQAMFMTWRDQWSSLVLPVSGVVNPGSQVTTLKPKRAVVRRPATAAPSGPSGSATTAKKQ